LIYLKGVAEHPPLFLIFIEGGALPSLFLEIYRRGALLPIFLDTYKNF
jgi:hypothetical protein